MVRPIIDVLVERDGISREEARRQVRDFREFILDNLENIDPDEEILNEFGLEPDYLDEILF